jgi:general secretion pathway protein C
VVTSLNLKLYGVSENRATGRGSAIIAAPDGLQRSFAVGEEVMPGVTLVGVSFDGVTIDRGGTREQLYLDQSPAATVVAPGTPPPPTPVVTMPAVQAMPVPPPPTAPALAGEVRYEPRMDGGRVTGVVVTPSGSGQAFRDAGLQPNDVVVSINGQPVNSPNQAQAIARQFGTSDTTVVVERGGQPVTLRVRAPR